MAYFHVKCQTQSKNFARNTLCFRCKASRPSGGPGDKGETTRDFAAEMREQIAQMQREVDRASRSELEFRRRLEGAGPMTDKLEAELHELEYEAAKAKDLDTLAGMNACDRLASIAPSDAERQAAAAARGRSRALRHPLAAWRPVERAPREREAADDGARGGAACVDRSAARGHW